MLILYVTDRRIDAYLAAALREAGHGLEATDRPADGLAMAAGGDFRAIVLDWSAPPLDETPRFAAAAPWSLLLVIADADGAQRAELLRAGADACLARGAPFRELEARLEALDRLIQRARPAPERPLPSVELVAAEQAIRVNGQTIALTGREFRAMTHLAAHAGAVVGLDQLQLQVWGDDPEPRPDLVRARLARLRRKLAVAGASLRGVGQGYVFEPTGAPISGAQVSGEDENLLTGRTAGV